MSLIKLSYKELHKVFCGKHDKYFASLIENKPTGTFLEKKRVTVHKNYSVVDFEKCDEDQYGYANFRILSNIDSITHLKIEHTGEIISEAYPHIIKDEYPFDIMKKNILPSNKNKKCCLVSDSTNDFEVEYDIFKLCDSHSEYKYFTDLYQSLGQAFYDDRYGVVLHFNYPIKRIILKSSGKLSDIKITFNKMCYVDNFVEINENYYECKFDETINFSKIDSPVLTMKTEPGVMFDILAESINVLVCDDERSRLYFST